MTSIIKSISLDVKTAMIAKRVPNFSRFVRECLMRWEAIQRSPDCPVERLGHTGAIHGNHCTPSPTRICLKHWPNGTPRMEDWREFRSMVEFDGFHQDRDRLLQAWDFLADFKSPEEWLQHRAEITNHVQIDFDDMIIEGNAKPLQRPKKGIIARIKGRLGAK